MRDLASASARRAQLLWLMLTAAAFGFVEGAVVVYLRAVAYPEGFAFPLREVPPLLLKTEVLREAATLLLILGFANAARRRPLARFAVFALVFGVWDLGYYLTLKGALDWPASLLDWDILFLIPAPWTSPVLAPVLVSLALVGFALPLLLAPEERAWPIRRAHWLLASAGGALILASFFRNAELVMAGGTPSRYSWWLFLIGMALGLGSAGAVFARRRP